MKAATTWAVVWFGCFFAIAFSDIQWLWIPLPHNMAVNLGLGAAVALIGYAPLIIATLSDEDRP